MSWLSGFVDARSARVPRHVPGPDVPRELVLYQYESCPYCYRVLRALHRLGLDVPTKNTLVDRAVRDELRALTGRTQVPMLLIDGVPLLESADIVTWLEAYATGGGAS